MFATRPAWCHLSCLLKETIIAPVFVFLKWPLHKTSIPGTRVMWGDLLRESGREWLSTLLPSNSGIRDSPAVLETVGEQNCGMLAYPTSPFMAGLSHMIFLGLKHADPGDPKCYKLSRILEWTGFRLNRRPCPPPTLVFHLVSYSLSLLFSRFAF